MANVEQAIAFILVLEDDKRYPGCITQLRGDSGGRTRMGIAEKFHPALSKQGFFEGDPIDGSTNPLRWKPTTISSEAAAPIVEQTYASEYAAPLGIAGLASQDLANRLLGFGVNEGIHQAAVTFQRCIPGITADGSIGSKTIAAANALDPVELIGRMKQAQVSFYKTIAATQPGLSEYAGALANRARS